MINALESATRELAAIALDAYAVRNRAIAQNVANHASEGYKPLALDFESYLTDLRTAVSRGAGASELSALMARMPAPEAMLNETDGTVNLDEQMGELMRNTLEYEALLNVLGRLGSLNRSVIEGGTR